jgi:hypothetical protein
MPPEQDTAQDLQDEEVKDEQLTEEQKDVAEKLDASPQQDGETHEQYGKRVQDRINKMTRKIRETERELETIRSTTRQDFEGMAENNRQLKEALEAMKQTANVIAEQTRPKPVDMVKELDTSIKELKGKRAEALDNADFKLLGIIDDQLDDLKEKKYEAKMQQELSKEREKIEQKVTATQKADPQLNPTIEAWVEDTPWYNDAHKDFDPVMQAAAIAIHGMVINEPTWKSKTLRQQLNETKRRTEAKFNGGKGSSPPTVEGVSSMSAGTVQATNLSEDQKRVARMLYPELTPKDAEKKYTSGLGR